MVQVFVYGQLLPVHVLLEGQVVFQDRGRFSFQAEGSPSGWKASSVSSPFSSFNRISTFRSASSSLVPQNREILTPSSKSFSAFSNASSPCSSSPTIFSRRANAFSKSLYSLLSLFLSLYLSCSKVASLYSNSKLVPLLYMIGVTDDFPVFPGNDSIAPLQNRQWREGLKLGTKSCERMFFGL